MSLNPNDDIRRQVLGWFYQRNTNATSQYGKKGSASKISDVKRGLKETHGLSQQQVMSNLTYLIVVLVTDVPKCSAIPRTPSKPSSDRSASLLKRVDGISRLDAK